MELSSNSLQRKCKWYCSNWSKDKICWSKCQNILSNPNLIKPKDPLETRENYEVNNVHFESTEIYYKNVVEDILKWLY